MSFIMDAIIERIPKNTRFDCHLRKSHAEDDFSKIIWPDGIDPPTWQEIEDRAAEISAERKAESAAARAKADRLAYLDVPEAVDAILEYLDQQSAAGLQLPPKISEILDLRRAREQPGK